MNSGGLGQLKEDSSWAKGPDTLMASRTTKQFFVSNTLVNTEHIRVVKMAEKLNSNFVLKYYQKSN